MIRKSKREIQRELEDLEPSDEFEGPRTVRIRDKNADGELYEETLIHYDENWNIIEKETIDGPATVDGDYSTVE